MVSVAQEDRDALRFFWVDDITASLPDLSPCDLLGVFSSPFLLNATIRRHVEGYRAGNPLFVDKFIHSIYVDDLTSGSDTEEGAIDLYTKCMAEAEFNLRKFISNSPAVQAHIPLKPPPKQQLVMVMLQMMTNPTRKTLLENTSTWIARRL